jgi:hypothetical protein
MRIFLNFLASLCGVLVGAAFLSGARVYYVEWFSFPASFSKVVVALATLCFFVRIFLFFISFLKVSE